jgi:hypothetical protein
MFREVGMNKKVDKAPLSQWLNEEMGKALDPETGERGVTAYRLSQLVDLSQTLIWDILKNGKVPRRIDKLIELGRFFGKSPVYMFRLAYLPKQGDLPEEVQHDLLELEDLLSHIPPDLQAQYMSSLLEQAKMMYAAAVRWRNTEPELDSDD